MEQVLTYAINSGAGVFAVLFIALLAWVLKTNNDREVRYLGVIDKYGDQIYGQITVTDGKVDRLKEDVDDLKTDVGVIKSDVSRIMGAK